MFSVQRTSHIYVVCNEC